MIVLEHFIFLILCLILKRTCLINKTQAIVIAYSLPTGGTALDHVISINRTGIFKFEEANDLCPILKTMTKKYHDEVEVLMDRLEKIQLSQKQTIQELEDRINELITSWHQKVKRLGGYPHRLWVVHLDSGEGYYSWEYPQPEIKIWHSYEQTALSKELVGFNGPFPEAEGDSYKDV